MIIYTIYKCVNRLNGKVYIGFDSDWPSRQKEHKYYTHKRKQTLYYAIRKYGWDNFDWEVVYQSKEGEHCLNVMENYFITQYDSYKNGYNQTLGGEGSLGRILNNTTKNKISNSLKNKPKSEEHIKKMSDSRKGKKQSPETILKRSQAMKATLKKKKESLNILC